MTSKPGTGGDSHSSIIVVFTNHGSLACSLYGYPGAAVLDSGDRQIVQAKRSLNGFLGGCGCRRPAQLRILPRQTASALIEGDNGGGDECLRGRALLVTPPNTTASTRITFRDYSCHVEVHPVITGSKGTVG
ncbi:MAG: hypothetical protein JWQ77_2181 [Jatrophihabitans sp.]|nr:hypothetical protein [Jatrophihabitans sp.]